MIYQVLLDSRIETDVLRHTKSGNKYLVKKLDLLINELSEHPRQGTGRPEQLKECQHEIWSRRIDSRHRLIYEIRDSELIVIAISAFGHYDDK